MARSPKVHHFINCRWVASWLSIVYYRLAVRWKGSWLHIPASNGCEEDNTPPLHLVSTVQVHYPQGSRNLCLIKGLCSALHYMDLHEEASMMDSVANTVENLGLPQACQCIKKYMVKFVPCIGIGISYNTPRSFLSRSRTKRNNRKMTIKSLLTEKTPFPTLVILLGADESVNHAFCVVDDLIFDATHHKALKLCEDSLHWTCGKLGYKDIYFALRFKRGWKCHDLRRTMKLHK